MVAVKVGIVGAGTVGSGVIEILLGRPELLERRSGVKFELAGVAELDREAAIKAGAPEDLIVDDYKKLTESKDVDIIVELIGGTGIADAVVRSALENGKAVVTANKALLAENGLELFELSAQKNAPLAFEAAVAGGIPIILALREGLVANNITSLLGIVNGTCNYILSEMIEKGVAYEKCLKDAQDLGYAEADPTFDVEGFDSGHKLALLSALAFESWVEFETLHIEGINNVDLEDVSYAEKLGYTVKLLAVARPDGDKIFLSVHPALLSLEHPMAGVHGSMNAIALEGDVVMESMYYGRGAGKLPTASAVVADIVTVGRDIASGSAVPAWTPPKNSAFKLASMDDYSTCYYLRFMVEDKAGVLAKITTELGENGVSIATVHQHNSDSNGAPVVITTHQAAEGGLRKALKNIEGMDFMKAAPVMLRIEK